MTAKDRPLSYWISVARMGFENDFNRLLDELDISQAELARRVGSSPAYVSKFLNGTAGNFQLSTMAKWARAIGAIVQIRLIAEDKEVVRVVDYETAGVLDDKSQPSTFKPAASNVVFVNFEHGPITSRVSASPSSIVTGDYKVAPGG